MEGGEHEEGESLHKFFRFMAVCHTVVCDRSPKGDIEYQASSPDELALL